MPEPAVGAEVGPALALDSGDEGRIKRVPLASVPALPETAQLPLLSRWLLHFREGMVGPNRCVNSFGRRPPAPGTGGPGGLLTHARRLIP